MNRSAASSRYPDSRIALAVALLLSLLPLCILIGALCTYAVDLPIWDEWWAIVTLIQKYFNETLRLSDFWSQHNEHRLIFPRLLMLGLAILSDYDTRWEMGASVVFALLIYLLLVRHVWRNRCALGMERSWMWLCVFIAYAVFSLRQHENWFWGFQVQWYMNVFGVVLGAFVLTNQGLTLRSFGVLLGCGIFSLFSLSAGAFFWVLIPLFMLFMHFRISRIPRIWFYVVAWSVLFGMLLFFYFQGMRRGNYPGGLLRFMEEPGDSVQYVLLYLAGLVTEMGSTDFWSLAVGAAGLLLFVGYGLVLLARSSTERCRPALFFLFLGCYAIGCAVVTGVGRSGFGLTQASSSRYTTMSMLFWIAILFFLYSSLCANAFLLWKDRVRVVATVLLFLSCCTAIVSRGYASLAYIRFASEVYGQARISLKYSPDPRILGATCNSSDFIIHQARPFLLQQKLSVFRAVDR